MRSLAFFAHFMAHSSIGSLIII